MRRLGSRHRPINQHTSMNSVLKICEGRTWEFSVMTDLNLPYDEVRENTTEKGNWTMIVLGKVEKVLAEELADRWGVGGQRPLWWKEQPAS